MVRYKLIAHERTQDAPFVGALVSAIDCKYDCKNCFNQDLKTSPTHYNTVEEIIDYVESNPFNQGVIFGGLEWTLQRIELIDCIELALKRGLKVMVYTGMASVPKFLKHYPIYIKYGRYMEECKTEMHYEYGVKLASSNQHIVYLGED